MFRHFFSTVIVLVAPLLFHNFSLAIEGLDAIPITSPESPELSQIDYLIDSAPFRAVVTRSADGRTITMQNGLVRRVWRVEPNGACVAFDNLMTGQAMLRSVRPEARVTIDGKAYEVGGLVGQRNHAFLTPEVLDQLTVNPESMRLVSVATGKPLERFGWKRRRHAATNAQWPPGGVTLQMDYSLPKSTTGEGSAKSHAPDVVVSVHYELYDGLPAISKWIVVHNKGHEAITVDRITEEELAVVEQANWVEYREGVAMPKPDYLHVETDFAFGGFEHENANRHVVHWRTDPLYDTQVNYLRQTPCLLVCEPTYGPAQMVEPQAQFEGFRVFELVYDSADRERCGLALRRMYRTIAPWVTENPLTHHLLSNNPEQVKRAIDQAADVGFEAIILSFGSGFNMESRDPDYLEQWKQVADYAEARGIDLGSYSLFSSRNVGKEHMIVSPEGQEPTHGQCPAVTSAWGQQWLATIRDFHRTTGFDVFENDGPYPGDVDVTARLPLQKGINDSRWVQWRHTAGLYRWLREEGVYIDAPDYYYLNGSNKCGMGYREVNWSLPRADQVIHTRQNIYDGTWTKTPSMGWMFVPLTQYHGGGAAATVEPLSEHLDHYERIMLSNLGMGVQAHYRGPRLFDTDETREMVARNVAWFKKYRDILEADVIHGRRADGQELDWVLHADPDLATPGMLCVYNPAQQEIKRDLIVNLYYTGLSDKAQVTSADGTKVAVTLDRKWRASIPVTVAPQGMSWYVIGPLPTAEPEN
jgi:hypothetical protein